MKYKILLTMLIEVIGIGSPMIKSEASDDK